MRTIRQRITRPMIWNAILLPLVVLLVFNIFMRIYMISVARDDLQATTSVIETMVREQLTALRQEHDGTINPASITTLTNIRAIVRATSKTTGADILVTDRDGQIIFPVNPSLLNLSAAALSRLESRISQGLADGQVETISTISGLYLYQGFPLRPNNAANSPWVICLAKFDPTQGFLLVANLLLLAVLLLGSLFSMTVTVRTARRISAPLKHLHQFADRVAKGNYAPDEPDSFCREVAELQAQMNTMAADLGQSDQLQKTFLQNASHELRTPLMAIQGYAEGLQSGVVTDVAKAASIISSESRRLNRLVESLLTLSRIENQNRHIELVPIDLGDWLQDQVQRARGLVVGTDKTFSLNSEADSLMIQVDEELLCQAVSNILANAVRFARLQVSVTCGRAADSAWISITDDGPGIDAADLPHLFDRFYKGVHGQFGLGLAIANSAITALHGTLDASNASPGGAIFTIRLPLLLDHPRM